MQTLGDVVHLGTARQDSLVRNIVLVLSGSVFVAICAKIQIPGPVPMTLQTFAVMLVAATLGCKRGTSAILCYLLEGAAGIPVFARLDAGLLYFAGPTTGYLMGYVVAAYLVGTLAERGWDRHYVSAALAFSIGNIIILSMGYVWLMAQIGIQAAWLEGVTKFLIGDMLKIFLAAAAFPIAWKCVRQIDSSA